MVKLQVVVYTMNDCPFCEKAKNILKDMRISFEEKNVSSSMKYREELVRKSRDDKLPTVIVNETVLVKPGEDKLRATVNFERHKAET